MSALIEIRDLSVLYRGRGRRNDKVALEDVSISISAGETLGLVGESGSGKSTLGNCVLGLVQPTRGTIAFDGRDVTRASRRERRALSTQIQAVFQDPYSSFNPHRTIEQSVSETMATLPRMPHSDQRARVVAMLERVGLDRSALAKFPAQFSGGQRQRIAIARALLPEPRLVVCDESVSALDLSVQAQILNLLLELQRERGMAYVFITHDLAVVRHMSTRIAVLQQGHLVEEGDAGVVTEQPTHPYTRRLIAASLGADADLQQVRRATRKAMARVTAEGAQGHAGVGDQVLRALEQQAVAEALARPAPRATVMARALLHDAGSAVDVGKLIELRAAILELAPRTCLDMMPVSMVTHAEEARARRCSALSASGQATAFVGRYRELVAAIEAGDRSRVRTLVSSLDGPLEPAADPSGTHRVARTISNDEPNTRSRQPEKNRGTTP
ncbi:ABC transporter ATP-binding protein [Streptomyces fractus]|uniref:ABC transporter ATP-binding protein n=1 Tax=Streptomyces fractus TaxID=641806 RepID=UPI003CECC958